MTERQGAFARWMAAASRMRSEDPALFWARVVLGVAFVVLLVILVTGDPREGIPERLAEGKALRPKDYWRTWGWVFSLVNLGGVAVLLATARRWLG
ncbi:MAG: hypothetical protein JRG95_10445, partial [Deltaproteobacteria bacterium]|nr:hypothetical protein [Deltaproteobacteria bacterium]